ncbi:MAG: Nif11-like leader peptide family RiPP precursor [Terriglobia bacterium]
MSMRHASGFVSKVRTNKALRAKVKKATHSIMRIAKAHGYTFTREQLHDVLRKKWDARKLPPSSKEADPDTCAFLGARPSF